MGLTDSGRHDRPKEHYSLTMSTEAMYNFKNDGSGRLHQRVAIVTGSSSGMGRAIALALAQEGAVVVCSDLKSEAAQHGFEHDRDIPTHTVITNHGGVASFRKCDMGNTKEIIELIAYAVNVRSPSLGAV
jgi:NAD(P)-dependent dehydrogenase (short-subunit alcohol dehydrogenase family)